MSATLLVGTTKGLVTFQNSNQGYYSSQVHFEGMPISMIYADPNTGFWWAGVAHRHWGQKLHYTDNEGKTWHSVPMPTFGQRMWRPDQPAKMKKIWAMAHAGADKPGQLWLGTEPGGPFYSADNGQHFELVESLWNHPSRLKDNQWFGAGRDYPFIHSIVVNPTDSNHIYIGVSCAGVFESHDAGHTWAVRNHGLVAHYLPNPRAEVGHDPHLLLACQANPKAMWQQNHCGIFKSHDAGKQWVDVSGGSEAGHFPSYGFALAIDDHDPNQAWVIPATSDEQRVAVNLALCVCHTQNGGQTWQTITNGLPQHHVFDIVLRHSFIKWGNTLAFGTNNGNLYISHDRGQQWQLLTSHLPAIHYLAVAHH